MPTARSVRPGSGTNSPDMTTGPRPWEPRILRARTLTVSLLRKQKGCHTTHGMENDSGSASDTEGNFLGISIPLPGSTHDRKALSETSWKDLLADAPVIGAPAYQGSQTITPHKKPKGGELSARHKENNKAISRMRSAVERRIAHLKHWVGGHAGPDGFGQWHDPVRIRWRRPSRTSVTCRWSNCHGKTPDARPRKLQPNRDPHLRRLEPATRPITSAPNRSTCPHCFLRNGFSE